MSYSLCISPEHGQTGRLNQKTAYLLQQCGSDSFEYPVPISSGIAKKPKSDVLQRSGSKLKLVLTQGPQKNWHVVNQRQLEIKS